MAIEHSSSGAQAFRDRTVHVFRSTDDRCASFWPDEAAGVEQDSDGPVHIIVGKLASDARIQELAERYDVSADRLIAIRDRKWQLAGLRNRAGFHYCIVSDANGREFEEPIQEFVAAAPSRRWMNPADEIEAVSEFLAWLRTNRPNYM